MKRCAACDKGPPFDNGLERPPWDECACFGGPVDERRQQERERMPGPRDEQAAARERHERARQGAA